MLGGKGLVWYRGLIPGASRSGDADATPDHVEAVLKAFGVKALVVGHSTLSEVTAFHGGRVIGRLPHDFGCVRP